MDRSIAWYEKHFPKPGNDALARAVILIHQRNAPDRSFELFHAQVTARIILHIRHDEFAAAFSVGEHIAEVACATNHEEVGERVNAEGATGGSHRQGLSQQRHAAGVGGSRSSELYLGTRSWTALLAGQAAGAAQVYGNRRRIRGAHGKGLLRRRGELLERSFAHAYETGGIRRV
jgi:hypothetical protein